MHLQQMRNVLALHLAFSLLKEESWFSFGNCSSPFNAVLMGPSVQTSCSLLAKECSPDASYDNPNLAPRDLNSECKRVRE